MLLFGNHWVPGARNYRLVAEAARAWGSSSTTSAAAGEPGPGLAIAGADAVFGVGRCIVEAMASQRAAYVFGGMPSTAG